MGLFDWLFRRKRTVSYEEPLPFKVGDEEFRMRNEDGSISRIRWDEIEEVRILITEDGPGQPDVFLVLAGNGKECEVPNLTNAYDHVYDIVSQYPGFDYRQVIRAMLLVPDERTEFVVWNRSMTPEKEEDDGKEGKWDYKITVTDELVNVDHPEHGKTSIRWEELIEVSGKRTHTHGDNPEFWLILKDNEKECAIPKGTKGYKTIMAKVSKFEGFNIENMLHVARAADETQYLLWKK